MSRRRRPAATREEMQRAEMVRRVAEILDDPDAPSRFTHEGACRHGLRSAFCLAGAKWEVADTMAASIVSAALASIGARRPTWWEGQPEWTQDGFVPVERTTCVVCAGPLPEDERSLSFPRKYCSRGCKAVAQHQRAKIVGLQRSRSEYLAELAVRREHSWRQREVDCEHCGKPFIPRQSHRAKTARYCSTSCSVAALSEFNRRLPKRKCPECKTTFQPRRAGQKCCSTACAHAATTTLEEIACQHCGKGFRPINYKVRYCSLECSSAGRVKERADRQCPICLSIFRPAFPSDRKVFCSIRCGVVARHRGERSAKAPAAPAQSDQQPEDLPPIMLAAAE
jgi:hypothetical protein